MPSWMQLWAHIYISLSAQFSLCTSPRATAGTSSFVVLRICDTELEQWMLSCVFTNTHWNLRIDIGILVTSPASKMNVFQYLQLIFLFNGVKHLPDNPLRCSLYWPRVRHLRWALISMTTSLYIWQIKKLRWIKVNSPSSLTPRYFKKHKEEIMTNNKKWLIMFLAMKITQNRTAIKMFFS